ncbi:hypothetical protein [Marinomonas algarum]|uniref:Flagellar basal body rod FlgEFG protein C-terminal n=1 Tax=Marinomonas algarum TaxID=2883105 RepID=A0A9X1IMM7_9GAMM|nr:hypothetical protein [Marinomonas algarum]MCB5160846.1 hypothetical protein [Marinomonas algarum]
MQINSSSFHYGQQGLQNSQQKLEQASQEVASASLPRSAQNTTDNTQQTSESAIRDGLVDANNSMLNAQANAKVLATSDQTIGRLIDIMA